jgi:hypothetical protein
VIGGSGISSFMNDEDAAIGAVRYFGGIRAEEVVPSAIPMATDHDEIGPNLRSSAQDRPPRLRRRQIGLLDADARIVSGELNEQAPSLLRKAPWQ